MSPPDININIIYGYRINKTVIKDVFNKYKKKLKLEFDGEDYEFTENQIIALREYLKISIEGIGWLNSYRSTDEVVIGTKCIDEISTSCDIWSYDVDNVNTPDDISEEMKEMFEISKDSIPKKILCVQYMDC